MELVHNLELVTDTTERHLQLLTYLNKTYSERDQQRGVQVLMTKNLSPGSHKYRENLYTLSGLDELNQQVEENVPVVKGRIVAAQYNEPHLVSSSSFFSSWNKAILSFLSSL